MNVSSTITEAATEKNSIKELFCKNVIPLNWSAIIFQIFFYQRLASYGNETFEIYLRKKFFSQNYDHVTLLIPP